MRTCLKCRKNAENVNSKVSKTKKIVDQSYYENVLYVVKKIKIYEKTRSKRIIKQFRSKDNIE